MNKEFITKKIKKNNRLIKKRSKKELNKKKFNHIEEKDEINYNQENEYSKKGKWTRREDEILKKWVKENGSYLWTECSKLIKGRSGKQCRERWVNTLDPKIKKGNWNTKEQEEIFDLLRKNFTSWTLIAKNIKGRTENSIKNFFYSSIRRLKSNAIINFLKDIKSEELTEEKFQNLMDKMQIKSINHLSYLIVGFIIKNQELSTKENELKLFLRQLLLDDFNKDKKKIQINQNNLQPIINIKKQDNLEKEKMIEENEEDNEIVNHSFNLKDIKNDSSIQENMNIFLDLLNNLKYTNPTQTIKINIPNCWNCQKKQSSYHIETINNLYSQINNSKTINEEKNNDIESNNYKENKNN